MFAALMSAALLAAGPASAQSQSQARDEDLHWRVPLQQKAEVIQQRVYEVNTVAGNYVPSVPIPIDGSLVTHTPLDPAGDKHTSSWTGCYLMGAGFRLQWARAHGTPQDVTAALDHGGKIVGGLYILTHVSGTPGYLARYAAPGHGPADEERGAANERNEWHQGVGRFRDYRFRGNPSHHNYDHVMRGLGHWYYALTINNPNPSPRERAQIDSTRNMIREMAEFGYKSHNMVLIDYDGTVAASIISGVGQGVPTTTSLMATMGLKIGYWITGDPWYKAKYDELVERYGYRNAKNTMTPDKWQNGHAPDFDDTEHVLGGLWLVYRLEDDPVLKDFYKFATAQIFESKKATKRSPFNYLYASVTGDVAGADLPGALESLQLYPTNTLLYPLMNSIRTDINFSANSDREGYGNIAGRRGSQGVLPINDQPCDNAYTWKADPYRLDGYLASPIVSLAISSEDSMVWLLSNGSGLYRSLDGGKTFRPHDFNQGAKVNSVTFAGNKLRIVVLGTSKGIYWSHTGGYGNNWTNVPLGCDTNSVRQVILDPTNANVVWAVANDGIYRSIDLGQEEIGKAWTKVSGAMPAAKDVTFRNVIYAVAPGANPVMYAMIDGRTYRRGLNDAGWTQSPRDIEGYHIIPTPRQMAVSPADPNTVLTVAAVSVWGYPWSALLRTTDGGRTIALVGQQAPDEDVESQGRGLEGVTLASVTYDPRDPRVVYAATMKGFYRSMDGGMTWAASNSGLRIPYVNNVLAPREMPGTIYASTPAGLHVSTDQGRTWSRPILVLGPSNVDLGGLAYLVGYWVGRGTGFVTDEQATMPPNRW